MHVFATSRSEMAPTCPSALLGIRLTVVGVGGGGLRTRTDSRFLSGLDDSARLCPACAPRARHANEQAEPCAHRLVKERHILCLTRS
ncbi:hypothetical protein CBOM_07540 [Ceraceosorus bombacis]|uniref:Uncharacterized protein n=1 Tax=Ceraceosorus bombacis TaxID=401625 RepID=A0A0P1BEY8_9BASI|nr:hypothetical protein CBOM_07540 [Ceraceosorus bombacis]